MKPFHLDFEGTRLFLSGQAKEIPGITIFRSSATVYFANAELFLEALQEKVSFIHIILIEFDAFYPRMPKNPFSFHLLLPGLTFFSGPSFINSD